MTNKEKFLAGMWFSLDRPSEYYFDLFSFCTKSSCIQDRNDQYHCIFDMNKDGITCKSTFLSLRLVSVKVKFSEMYFYTDEEAKRILKR